MRDLNKVRNQLAHRLEVKELDELARNLVGTPKNEWRRYSANEKAVELRNEIMGLCMYIVYFVDELFKESRLQQLFKKISTRIKKAEHELKDAEHLNRPDAE